MDTKNGFLQSRLARAAVSCSVGVTLLMMYVNLAVGLIGGGPNPGNLMYIGVVVIVIAGMVSSRLRAVGMERTMNACVMALGVIIVIALATGMQRYPGSSVIEILGVNAFFATLFFLSGLLHRYVKERSSAQASR